MRLFTQNVIPLFFVVFLVFSVSCHHKKDEPKVVDHDQYDGPEEAARMEYERTKDPATGRVPRELLLTAIDQTIQSKLNVTNNPTSITSLTWTERGPNSDQAGSGPNANPRANNAITSGRIRAVMIDSSDASHKTVFVGGVDGGLWKTTDITSATPNWTLVNDYLTNLAIAAICQDPRPGFTNIMYFCTGESYNNFEAVQGNGVFKSIDGGNTWNYLPSTSTYVYGTRILCDYLGNIYLGTRGTGLLRSTAASGGATWTNITPSGLVQDICDMEISSTKIAGRLHVVAGILTTQAYRFTDIPATVIASTWTSPVTPFPSYANRAEIACSGSTLYALPVNSNYYVPGIYKSTDGGLNWVATTANPPSGWVGGNGILGQGWYSLGIDINPSDPSQCIIGCLDTWKTTTGGGAWGQISTWVGNTPVNQYVHADVHKIIWYDGGNKVIFASDGGIFYSADGGATIRDRNTGLRIKQFYSCAIHPITTNYFLAGAQDNGVHQFTLPGLGSTVEVTGGDGGFVAIDQNQPQFQFGSYVHNDYRRSTDGGNTWVDITLDAYSGQFINPFDYDNSSNIMYCGDDPGTYRRWTDPQTGSTSSVINISNLSGKVTAVYASPYTANRVFLGTDAGKVIQVDNANTIAPGAAAIDRSAGLPIGTVSCINQGVDSQHLIATFSNYNSINVWVSTDGGSTWTASDGNLPNMPVRWAMFYPGDNTKAYVATETGVWETAGLLGGSTVWTANNSFPTVRTDMLKFRPSDRTIVAATHGRGLWSAIVPYLPPALQFQNVTATVTEATGFVSACRGYTDYTYNMNITAPPTGAAIVTLGVVAGGTATQNVDYAITTNGNFVTPNMVLTFPNGVSTPQAFTIRVYDDAAVESPEIFSLNYSISGTTNAQAGASNQTFTMTINDNDAPPFAAGNLSGTIGTYNASLSLPFAGGYSDSRTQLLYNASELSALGFSAGNITSLGFNVVSKASTQPYFGLLIKLKNTTTTSLTVGSNFETGGTLVYYANTTTYAGLNTLVINPFAWDGVSNLLVDMCYDNSTATANDLVTGSTGNSNCVCDRQNTNATPGCSLLSSTATFGNARPNITLAISTFGTTVSSTLNSGKTAYLGPMDDVYFYDNSGYIMARIKNLTSFDYGCTQVIIDRAGSTSAQFWNNNTANYLASKSVRVIPTNNTATGNYQVTLYYAGGEVTGWQTATGQLISSAQLVKITNGFYIPDVSTTTPHVADVIVAPATSAPFGNVHSTLTTTFNNTGFSGFGMGYPCNPLNGILLWTGAVNTSWSNPGNWSCGILPQSTSDVQINSGLVNYPVVSSNVTIKSLLVKPGASVTVASGFTLSLH